MKSKLNYKKPKYPIIVEIDFNPNIFLNKENRSISVSKKGKSGFLHKKINSAQNHYSKLKENKKMTFTLQNNNQSKTTIQTPEINSKYQLTLERLNSNICSLKNKYADLLKENIDNNNRDASLKLNFLKIKRDQHQKEMNKKRQQYIIVKNTKLKEEQKKNQKIKNEYHENKKKELKEKRKEVKKLKNKEINDFKNHKINMMANQINKKRIKEEVKHYIEERLNEQKNKNILEIEKRKIINQEKQQKTAERMLENQVTTLRKIEEDLESKVKIQNNINHRMNKQYYKTFKNTINDENIKNSY